MNLVSKAERVHVLIYSFIQRLRSDILSAPRNLSCQAPLGITGSLVLTGPRESTLSPDLPLF